MQQNYSKIEVINTLFLMTSPSCLGKFQHFSNNATSQSQYLNLTNIHYSCPTTRICVNLNKRKQ